MSSYDGRERFVLTYEAHGGNAVDVLADAERIARSALPDGIEPLVEVGSIRPNVIATDGSGRHEVQRWVADVTATADVGLPESERITVVRAALHDLLSYAGELSGMLTPRHTEQLERRALALVPVSAP